MILIQNYAYLKIFLGNGEGHDCKFITTFPFGLIHQNIFTSINNKSKNTNGNVIIGNDVWIGDNTTIMSGVTIGDGTVIAANSHVVKDIKSYSIAGGNPCNSYEYIWTS